MGIDIATSYHFMRIISTYYYTIISTHVYLQVADKYSTNTPWNKRSDLDNYFSTKVLMSQTPINPFCYFIFTLCNISHKQSCLTSWKVYFPWHTVVPFSRGLSHISIDNIYRKMSAYMNVLHYHQRLSMPAFILRFQSSQGDNNVYGKFNHCCRLHSCLKS